jgi:F0F1-type ATP synthase assembly protein I
MSQEPTPREMGYYAQLAQVGVEMFLPAALGAYLDDWLGTSPWITAGLAILGFAAGLIHLLLILKNKERDESADKKPPP